MQDPNPANITGKKAVTHSVEHRIDWGHVAVAVAVLVTVYAVFLREHDREGGR